MIIQAKTRFSGIPRLYLAGVFALVVVLGLFGSPSVSADSSLAPDSERIEAIFGTAVEVRPPDAIVVASNSGLITLNYDSASQLKIGQNLAGVEDVVEGDRVISTAVRNTGGDLVALKTVIQLANSQPVTKHIVGVVTNLQENVISIQTRNGDVVSVVLPAGVEAPQVSYGITLVAKLDRSSGVLTAGGFELTSKTVKRLEEARDRAADAAEKQRLSQIAVDARSKHLSALDDAARALQRIISAGRVDQESLDRASEQFGEIQARFAELRGIYENSASDRNEERPLLSISGALVGEIGPTKFTIVPRGEQDVDPFSVEFSYEPESTLVELPQALRDEHSLGRIGNLLLADVRSFIDQGSELDLRYSIDEGVRTVVSVRVRPPRLVEELEAVLEKEAHRSFHGVITLVDIDDSLADALGIVIAANKRKDIKVAAKVTDETEITLDGAAADISALATGQAVDIQFESPDLGSLTDNTSSGATLRALAIRARSSAPEKEDHISGVVESVELDESAITIRPTDGQPALLTIGEDVPIIRNGERSTLGEVVEGDLVVDATRVDSGSSSLTRLIVVARTNVKFTGTITGIGQEPARLRVTGENGRTLNVLVTDETWIVLDGRRVRFEDVETGLRVVNGVYTVAGRGSAFYNVATIVSVESPKVGRASGIVTEVNVSNGTLTIVSGRSTETRSLKLHLPERPLGENLQKDGLPIRSLLDVERGDRVDIVLYVIETGAIEKLSVVSDDFIRSRGALLEVSADRRFARVELSSGEVFDLWIEPDSTVTLNGREVEALEAVAKSLEDARGRGGRVNALVPNVLFRRDSVGSQLGVIISIQIQITAGQGHVEEEAGLDVRGVEVTVSGVIEAITGDVWVIDGRVFVVDENTEFLGEEPEVGLVAKAALVSSPDGQLVAQAVSIAGRPDTSPTRKPIDVRPDTTDSPEGTDDNSRSFELRGLITELTDDGFVVETVRVAIGDGVDVDRSLLRVGATVRVKVRQTADGSVVAASIEVLRPVRTPSDSGGRIEPERPPVALPPQIDEIVKRFAGGLDETDGPVARLGDSIVIVPNSVITSVLLGGTTDLENRFKVTPVKRSDLVRAVGARLAAQLDGNQILALYTSDETHPLYLIEAR